MADTTTYFLLTYDRRKQKLVGKRTFEDEQVAASEYALLEAGNRGNSDIEVVLVGADSEATLHHTHGHYFGRRSRFSYLGPVLAL